MTGLTQHKPQGRRRAFTLTEILVAMGVFSLVVLALIYSHMFGLRQDQLVESKLGASDQSRKAFNKLMNDIRSAKRLQIGNMSGTEFTAIADGTLQEGNALRLNITSDTNISTYYYYASADGDYRLCRLRTGQTDPLILASDLIDCLTFKAEDYTGSSNVLSTVQQKYIVHFTLKFRQYQYPLTKVGRNCLYDLYKMEFRVTNHAPD